jgi:hypothetical protein
MIRERQLGSPSKKSDILSRIAKARWWPNPSHLDPSRNLPFRSLATRRSTEQLEKHWRETAQAVGVAVKLEAGGTDVDRAKWLLDFAVVDLDTLSEGDWLNLRQAADNFIAPPSLTSTRRVSPRTLKVSLRELQKWISSGLASLVVQGTWTLTTEAPIVLGVTPLGLTDVVFQGDAMSFGAAFQTRAYQVLTSTASRFRVCLECRRPLIAGKGQEYCTMRCSQAVRTRRFTAKHGRRAATARKKK